MTEFDKSRFKNLFSIRSEEETVRLLPKVKPLGTLLKLLYRERIA